MHLMKTTRPITKLAAAALLILPGLSLAQRQPQAPAGPTEFKFDFGPGKAAEGFVQVPPTQAFPSDKPIAELAPGTAGFDLASKPSGVERGGADPMHDGLVTGEQPFAFSVKLPSEGNYRVTVTLGDSQGDSDTTIRAESGRLVIPSVKTAAGKFETRTFITNYHTSHVPPPPTNAPGGSEIRSVFANELSSLHWDDKFTIEFNGKKPAISAIEIARVDNVPTIFVGGDSTVADPRGGPGGNWPTQMCQWFKPEVSVANHAQSGETLKSFITGLRMDKVLSQMKKGDFFLIQFGTNDSKSNWPQTYAEPGTTYNAYLKAFIAETRRRGATLVLVSPMERQQNADSLGPWARAMREVAKEENVPFIDQWAMSKELYTAMGNNSSMFNDQTHPSNYGGYLLSKVVVMGIKKNVPELAKYIVDDFKDLDFAHPDPAPEYLGQAAVGGGGRGGRGARGATTAPAGRGN